MKAIYHAMNMFNLDVTQRCLIAECWCPVKDIPEVQAALARGTVSHHLLVHVPCVKPHPLPRSAVEPLYHQSSTECPQMTTPLHFSVPTSLHLGSRPLWTHMALPPTRRCHQCRIPSSPSHFCLLSCLEMLAMDSSWLCLLVSSSCLRRS